MKKLYVDDCRPVPDGWALARTVSEAVAMLDAGAFEEVSLDFMIADRFEDNFAPVARHIVAMPAEKRPRVVYLHTSSAEGARQLKQILAGAVDVVVPRRY